MDIDPHLKNQRCCCSHRPDDAHARDGDARGQGEDGSDEGLAA